MNHSLEKPINESTVKVIIDLYKHALLLFPKFEDINCQVGNVNDFGWIWIRKREQNG